MIVGAVGALGILVSACASSNDSPIISPFTAADCRGNLVEIARFTRTGVPSAAVSFGTANNLALDGDTLYMTYAYAATESGLPISGGIVAVPVSGAAGSGGGLAGTVVAAADPVKTSEWNVDSFWASGGQIYLQAGPQIVSVPANPPTPSTLAYMFYDADSAAYAHDADFGYSATVGANGFAVAKTPIDGGAPTVLATDPAAYPPSWLGGMADAGDAVLLQASTFSSSGGATPHVWRIPKDGSARTDVRPDVNWGNPLDAARWLAWDGTDIIGLTLVQNDLVQSRVAMADTSAPVQTRFDGNVATRRNDEILSFQTMRIDGVPESSSLLLVASSKGAPAGTVVACSGTFVGFPGTPAGIAANDGGIYVSYWSEDHDTVIARVAP
jgi:hypothetical protein